MDTDDYVRWRDPKKCFIPTCPNDDIKNPGMQFICIRKELKERWCKLVNRNCPKRKLYCCEAHLKLEEDLENYGQWVCSGAKPRLKVNAVLRNITEQVLSQNTPDTDQSLSRLSVAETSTSCKSNKRISVVDAGVQHYAITSNKGVLWKPSVADKSTNFRARKVKTKLMPSLWSHSADLEETPEQSGSVVGTSTLESSSSQSSAKGYEKRGREHIMTLIQNKPKMYIGLPKNFWWLIAFICQQYSCVAFHIILTLFKIKNNDSFIRMSEQFEIARSSIKLIFEKNLKILATYFQNFIYLPTPIEIKKNLPPVFKIRYSNVQCIIDCFEIQIEKPNDPVRQAQTWSQYKSANTIKYLIGCTPSGMICFISKGFGGRISDKAITEKSNFIDILPPNAVIMADRGFKEIEAMLCTKNIKILRPPSVFSSQKQTKKEVIQTKVIASLRVHVERVIRRVREFQMLKPHSVINHRHVKFLDEIVIIACGLINLQEPIIKDC